MTDSTLTKPATGPLARLRVATADSLFRNSAFLLLATVELAAGGFLFWQVVAHLFPAAEVGRAGALISASVLIGSCALLGMHNAVIRYLRVWEDDAATVDTALTTVLVAATAGALAFVALAPAVAPELAGLLRHPLNATLFVLLTSGYAVNMVGDNVFVAARRSGFVLGRNTVVVVLRLLLPLACLGLGALGIFTAYQGAMVAALVVYLFALRRVLGLPSRLRLRRDRLAAMWRYSAWNYLATVILMLPALLMPILVAEQAGPAAAAYYYVAALLAGTLAFVPQATSRSFFAEAERDRTRMRTSLGRVVRLTLAVELPMLLGLLLGGHFALSLFGRQYAAAYPLLVVLAVTQALTSVGYVGSTVLMVLGRLRLLCALSAAASAAALLGAYLLVGRGLIWAGWSLLIGEVILAAIYLLLIRSVLAASARS
ncbi:lipopolysaccharide biosynthesis protein [Actinoplanes sp. NPDC004185]